MHISLDKDVHPANTIQLDLIVLVEPPIAHLGKIFAVRLEFLVAFSNNDILVQACGQFQTLL